MNNAHLVKCTYTRLIIDCLDIDRFNIVDMSELHLSVDTFMDPASVIL